MLRNPMRPAAILVLIAVSASLAPCVADPVELSTFITLAQRRPRRCFNTDRATHRPLTCSFRAAMVRIRWQFLSTVDAGA
jgi:hypothetical protein